MAVDAIFSAYRRWLAAWVSGATAWAPWVCAVCGAVTVAALVYFVGNVKINTSTSDMLSAELPFRQYSRAIDDAFPQTDSTMVVVVEGQTADIADDAALLLAARLRGEPKLFSDVYDLQGDAFFRRNGLLYLGPEDLDELTGRLAASQPFLASLWRDSSLRGFLRMIGLAVDDALASDASDPLDLAAALNAVADVAEAQSAGEFKLLSWTNLMGGGDQAPADRRRFIIVKPRLDHGSLQPAETAIRYIRAAAAELGVTEERGLRVRLTGSVVLDEQELQSVEQGMTLAAVISLVLVLVLLFVGLRSALLIFANLVTLICGLIWTAAFALLTIGSFNLISVAFAVLFIGLSVDFGIHFALRYREELWRGHQGNEALAEAAGGVGGALTLCMLSAAAAFFAFLPTDYVGLAELGLIAGAGMFIAFFANLTMLPAIIALFPLSKGLRAAKPELSVPGADLPRLINKHAHVLLWTFAASGVAAAIIAWHVEFDFDPLNLKDPNTESVATLRDLMADGSRNHYTIDILAPSLSAAIKLTDRLEKSDLVDKAVTLSNYVPGDQDSKLFTIGNLALFIAPSLSLGGARSPRAGERKKALEVLRPKLQDLSKRNGSGLGKAAGRLLTATARFLEGQDERPLLEFENRLLTGLPGRFDALQMSLEAEPVTMNSLPDQLRRRLVADDGRALIEVFPNEAIADRQSIRDFVSAVRAVAPNATGSPVVILEAGNTVLRAFAEATAIATLAIAVFLMVVLRRWIDMALVFAPLVLAAVWTMAATVLLGVAFNLANIIVLPLLFGLGVAGGIHLVLRARTADDVGNALKTSTPRAVLFSALTTIGSFGSISLSGHPGTASMGVLLTLAIIMTLIANLVFLPALLQMRGQWRAAQTET